MMIWAQFVLVASLAWFATSLPLNNSEMREKLSPVAREGYTYNRPAARFSTGCRYNCKQQQEEPQQEEENDAPVPSYGAPAQPEEEPQVEDTPEEQAPPAIEPKVERRPASKEGKRRRNQGGPSYSNFFPMMFNTPGGNGRNAGADGGQSSGGSTAIANSFSSGKGAMATSHATSFGSGADPNQYKQRNSPSRYRV